MALVCNDDTFAVLQDYTRSSLEFVNTYKWIADAYVSDFFFKNLWDNIPQRWQPCLQGWTTEDLTLLLDTNKSTTSRNVPAPLSLLSFKACTQAYSLDRNCATDFESIFQQLFPKEETRSDLKNCDNGALTNQKPKDTHEELHAFFKKHVKQKKRHEIQNLSKVINLLSEVSDCKCVIDVGSGLGHLSRLLSFRYGLKVISVEAAGSHAPKASKYDRDVEREVLKKKVKGEKSVLDYFQSESSSLPCHVTQMIHPNTTTDEFMDAIRQTQSSDSIQQAGNGDTGNCTPATSGYLTHQCTLNSCKKMKFDNKDTIGDIDCVKHSDNEIHNSANLEAERVLVGSSSKKFCQQNKHELEQTEGFTNSKEVACDYSANSASECVTEKANEKIEKFILTGLHACGDLTATFLRFFVNCAEAKGLASVGCCYMKLSDDSCLPGTMGYPLSRCITETPNHQLSYAARELACHFADAYCLRLRECPPHLRIHSYRAALEWIANQINPTFQRSAIQIPAKKTNSLDFESYVNLGLGKLGLSHTDVTPSMLATATQMTSRWKDVVSFYTVRLALAPVIETIILLDRMLFLYENGHHSAIVPIFDPSLSPRNFVLLAWKN